MKEWLLKNFFNKASTENKEKQAPENSSTMPYEPIVFVNKPISNIDDDIVGFRSQIETIKEAIDSGADMIALVADYGAGKSSIADILYKDDINYQKIRINLWDSISTKTSKIRRNQVDDENNIDSINENISLLTKSFLYQLANGYDAKEENNFNNSKLTSYVTKRLSNSHNLISFATSSESFWHSLLKGAAWLCLYLILSYGSKLTPFFNLPIMKFLIDINPLFLLLCIGTCVWAIRDSAVAFSNIKNTEAKKAEISDVFDIYNIIAKKLYENDYAAKQIIIVEDLDRIIEKDLIIGFLKEIYRFHNLLPENMREKFVFIIALKPETSLKPSSVNSNEEINNVYSKIFDLIVFLKPIHLSDYEAVLLNLINNDCNKKSKEKLVKLLTDNQLTEENDIFNKRLPKEFKWITEGDNLTIRQLKDRLNQAVEIMLSLRIKNYKNTQNKAAIKFETCAAVSYLEAVFPKEYYALIKKENKFSELIQESYKIKRKEQVNDYKGKLISAYENILGNDNELNENDSFKETIVQLIIDGSLDEDFKMYFYTYPKNIYIKNVDEKFICDALLLPYDNNISVENLSISVEKVWQQEVNVVIPVIERCALNKDLHFLIYKNQLLLEEALKVDLDQSIKVFCDTAFEPIKNFNKYMPLLETIYNNKRIDKELFFENFIYELYNFFIDKEIDKEIIIEIRQLLSNLLLNDISLCRPLYLDEDTTGIIPVISEKELTKFNDKKIGLDLIDVNLINPDDYTYIIDYIVAEPLGEPCVEKASTIIDRIVELSKPKDVAEYLLIFLNINKIANDNYFKIIMECLIDIEDICNYLNNLDSLLTMQYLKLIDDKCIEGDFSQNILNQLLENELYKTYFLSCSDNELRLFEYDKLFEEIKEPLLFLAKEYLDKVVEIRKIIIEQIENVIDKFDYLFAEPFGLVTREELYLFAEFNSALWSINGKQIKENDVGYIAEFINERVNDNIKYIDTFNHLFDSTQNRSINNNAIKTSLYEMMNFNVLPFNKLEMEEKEREVAILNSLLALSQPQNALNFMLHTYSLVESLEAILIANASFHSQYKELFNQINHYTKKTLNWVKTQTPFALNTNIREALLKEGDETFYVISKFLYDEKFEYEPEKVTIEKYAEIYRNKANMFEHMKVCMPLLNDMMLKELYVGLGIEKIRPFYGLKQNIKFSQYIFETFDVSEKKHYLCSMGNYDDAEEASMFEKIITQDDLIQLQGDYRIKEHILNVLPTQGLKISYGKKWNAVWKELLEEEKKKEWMD